MCQVHAAEDEAVLDSLQGGDEAGVVHRVGVSLATGLVGAGHPLGLGGGQRAARRLQLAVQLAVGQVDDVLLGVDLAVTDRGGGLGLGLLGGRGLG